MDHSNRCPHCGEEIRDFDDDAPIDIGLPEHVAASNGLLIPKTLTYRRGDFTAELTAMATPSFFPESDPAPEYPIKSSVCMNCGKRTPGEPPHCPACGHGKDADANSVPAICVCSTADLMAGGCKCGAPIKSEN